MSGSNGVTEYYPMDLEEGPITPPDPGEEWVGLVWPGIKSGYVINREGKILSPKGNLLSPGTRGSSQTLWVTIPAAVRKPNASGISMRVDKLVLVTFVGPAGPDQIPIHLNEDPRDCRADNLKWGAEKELPDHLRRGGVNGSIARAARNRRKPIKKARAAAKTTPRAPRGGIEVLRLYRDGKLQITVDQDGQAKLPKLTYSADELARLAELAARAVEMNKLMKL